MNLSIKSIFLSIATICMAATHLAAHTHKKAETERDDQAAKGEPKLVQVWETKPALMVPESVLFDAEREILFVSNIEGEQPWTMDGTGSIAKVGLDGDIVDPSWVSGLNGPKGMAQFEGKLFVSDIERVAVIDIESGEIDRIVSIEGAKRLNDVTVDEAGAVYVSDSETGKIHLIEDGKVALFADGFEGLNGLLATEGKLYALASGKLYQMGAEKERSVVATGIEGSVDGVVKTGEDAFVVSSWNGIVSYVEAGKKPQKLLDTTEQGMKTADLGWNPDERIVYVPTFWNDTVIAYRLKD